MFFNQSGLQNLQNLPDIVDIYHKMNSIRKKKRQLVKIIDVNTYLVLKIGFLTLSKQVVLDYNLTIFCIIYTLD